MKAQTYARERLLRELSRAVKPHGRLLYRLANALVRVHPRPVIILGNQKSGTSAIAGLLGRATNQATQLDIFHMRDLFAPGLSIHDVVLSRFIRQNRIEFLHPILKEPGLTFLYDQLVAYFPHSPMAYVIRDPRANIRSILDRLGIAGTHTHLPPAALAAATAGLPVWRQMLTGDWLGTAATSHIETLAVRWNIAADVYLQHSDRMHLVQYEAFARDKVGTMTQLAQQLGLAVRGDISRYINVSYQPRGANRQQSLPAFFGVDNLACIERICGERMQQFGYQLSAER